MDKPISRRDVLKLAAVSGAVMAATPLLAQTASAPPPAPADTTPEGLALADAAYAAAGFPLPIDQTAEVRKQLAAYPGDFAKARKFHLNNGDAPNMNVSENLIISVENHG